MLFNLINMLTKPVNIREHDQSLLSKRDKGMLSQSSLIVVLLLFLNCGRFFGRGIVIQNVLSKHNFIATQFAASLLSKRALVNLLSRALQPVARKNFLHV